MTEVRQSKILEIISKRDIETQEELTQCLKEEGFDVTQATISRDIRQLKLTKIAGENGKRKYVYIHGHSSAQPNDKFVRVLREAFVSVDNAGNLLVIKTVSGMAMAAAAALDSMKLSDIVGCIAGDDTIMCAVKTVEAAEGLVKQISRIVSSNID